MKKTYTSQIEASGIINSKGARLSKKDGKEYFFLEGKSFSLELPKLVN
jgi:hypothetical protein